jgi:hypothetical protein
MADCERIASCPFFSDELKTMPAVAMLMKETYCHSDKRSCARYKVASAGKQVPKDLLPNDSTRAEQILKSA